MVVALMEKNEAMMIKIKELEGEFVVYRVAMGKRMLTSVPKKCKIDVSISKEFKGIKSTRDVDNLFLGMKQYFRAISIKDDVTKVNIAAIYFTDVTLMVAS